MYSVLVFTRTKYGADRVAKQLSRSKIPSGAIHSNRSQNQRARALQDFKDGKTRVLVATDIAARGIDVEGITHVINFDFPPHAEDYVHRIGRTGRANAVGKAISFITSDDHGPLRTLERLIKRKIALVRPQGFDAKAERPPASDHPKRGQGFNPHGQSRPEGGGGGNRNRRRRSGQRRVGR